VLGSFGIYLYIESGAAESTASGTFLAELAARALRSYPHDAHATQTAKTAAWKAWSRSGTQPTPASRQMSSPNSRAAWPANCRGAAVLEVAPGPGYFAIELAKLGPFSITGMDISHTFVEIASRRAAAAGVHVDFRQGNTSSMPFADGSFDFLLCRAAFKNFGQPVRALQEMCRVLKPGGRGLIIDLRRDASPESMNRAVDRMGLSAVDRVVTKLIFKLSLVKAAYTKQQFQQVLAQASFRAVDIQQDDMGFEILMTK
jgi:ubiquinone/menaquinone biosynthesis C-methylase UbiE